MNKKGGKRRDIEGKMEKKNLRKKIKQNEGKRAEKWRVKILEKRPKKL